MRRYLTTILATGLLAACVSLPSPTERRALADMVTARQGWQATLLSAGQFKIMSYAPTHFTPDAALTVYIEGDGFAWLNSGQPSLDPTPRDPLALRLALAHPDGNAVYLARPCQYVDAATSPCDQRYWTEQRFAPEVIEASNLALDILKTRFGAQRLTLVGYSGGGAVAALLAERRQDVERLVTVAGNLDHRAWTDHHRVHPLDGSLNPADQSQSLAGIRQLHFVGEKDKIVPPFLATNFANRFAHANRPEVRIIPGYDHHCCWVENWAQLWSVRK